MALSFASIPMAAHAQPQRLFYSGHSLMDQPLPDDVAALAASQGHAVQWSRHYIEGSSLRQRLATFQPPTGERFDVLLATEQHTLIDNLVWNDTVRQLRALQERFEASSPGARTVFFVPWLNVGSPAQPLRWIDYERRAAPLWRCTVAQANSARGVAAGPPIDVLPAATMLAALVERATQSPGLPGLSADTPAATMQRLFRDDVHLTPLGSYFVALVVHGWLFERSGEGAAVPAGLDSTAARVLQQQAWLLVQQERSARAVTADGAACRERLHAFVGPYSVYVRDVVERPQRGAWGAWMQWAKRRLQWIWRLRPSAGDHPWAASG